ncbi:hypothetical protein BGZ65_000603, partial [Modicella reniformis]
MTQEEVASSSSITGATALPDINPKVEDLKASRKTGKSYRHTFPVHTESKPSPLSKEAPPESYRGFVNLGLLLLFGNNVRLIIENYQKYGILISLPGSNISREDWLLTGLAHVLLPLNVIVSFQVERLAKKWTVGLRKRLADTSTRTVGADDQDPKHRLKEAYKAEATAKRFQSVVGWVHTFIVLMIISWPSYMSYYKIYHPFLSMTCLINGTIMFFKMTSYALVHQDLRAAYIFDEPEETFHHLTKVHHSNSARKEKEEEEVKDEVYQYDVHYPDNVTFLNMAYFWLAPTLCYQPSYPRTKIFRKSFFVKRALEFITCVGMMYFLIEQYATPTLQNSIRAVDRLDFGTMLERILKLSTTSVLIWLLMFYTFFHAAFNFLAEMLYFGDRCFYMAWWNAGSVAMYWRLWNKPIYTFFKRHVYLPLIMRGVSPLMASLTIFTISAVMHEIVVGLPTHTLYGYAFGGMFFQIPLIALTRPLEKWRGA